jgi:hypothetical protein
MRENRGEGEGDKGRGNREGGILLLRGGVNSLEKTA